MSSDLRTPPTAEDAHPLEPTNAPAPTLVDHREQAGCALPRASSGAPGLPLLPCGRAFRGTLWIPRILWALEWGRREGQPRLSAADIARVLTQHAGIAVPRHNVARAFRDYGNDAVVARFWSSAGRLYAITQAGTRTLETLLAADEGP